MKCTSENTSLAQEEGKKPITHTHTAPTGAQHSCAFFFRCGEHAHIVKVTLTRSQTQYRLSFMAFVPSSLHVPWDEAVDQHGPDRHFLRREVEQRGQREAFYKGGFSKKKK